MSEFKMCVRQDSCPLLLEALHEKVMAEGSLRMAKAEFDGKRKTMNELYKAAKRCRDMQRYYFSHKNQQTFAAALAAEADLDRVLEMCVKPRTPNAPCLPGLEGGAK